MSNKKFIICFLILGMLLSGCQKDFEFASEDLKRLGTSAHDLLSAEKYTSLKVEIAYMPGYEPNAQSIKALQTFLTSYLNKPTGIQIVVNPIKSGGNDLLDLKELVLLEKQNRSVFTIGKSITVFIVIADKKFVENDVLATSYWNTSFCLFGPSLNESSGGIGQVSKPLLTTILLQHEFGHLLGLVGQGSPMQQNHRDQDNGAHCNNPACLMYYGIETADNLGGSGTIPKLDFYCLADLKANGGK